MRAMRPHVALAGIALVAGCGWRTQKDVQRDYARTLRPANVEPPRTVVVTDAQTTRVFRVRAYADRAYQAQTLRWRERIRDQVNRANRVIEAQFGSRLELVDVRDWQRTDRVGELRAAIKEIAVLDPATDVDWVVGFVSSLAMFTDSHEQLGMAYVFGRHLVLRGMDSLAEADAARIALDKLSANEREELLQKRRVHKETSVLLHEWAHTLGAFHERAPEWIMSPLYDKSQAGFSHESAELVTLGLRSRDARDAVARAAWGRAYRELVERNGASAWDAQTRDEAVKIAHAALGAGIEPIAAGRDEPRDGMRPLAPEDPRKHCALAYARARRASATVETCRAAAAVPGADLELVLLVPELLMERRDRTGAFRATADAEAVVAARQGDLRSWLHLAQLYAAVDACSGAERAVSRLPATHAGGKQILADCTRTRRWAGFRRGHAGVPPDREPEYVALLSQARRDVEAKNFSRARSRARELAKGFPDSAGAQIISCFVEGRAKAFTRARPVCAAAAAADDEAIIPQEILGAIAAEEGHLDEARERLRRALDLDDSSGEVWIGLATVEKRRGDAASLAALKRRYRDRFDLELRER